MSSDFFRDGQSLFVSDRLLLPDAEAFELGGIVSQIELGTDQDNRDVGSMVFDFWKPLYRS